VTVSARRAPQGQQLTSLAPFLHAGKGQACEAAIASECFLAVRPPVEAGITRLEHGVFWGWSLAKTGREDQIKSRRLLRGDAVRLDMTIYYSSRIPSPWLSLPIWFHLYCAPY